MLPPYGTPARVGSTVPDRRWSRVTSYSHFRSNAWGCRLAGTRTLLGSSASLPLAPLSLTPIGDKGLTEVLTSPNKPKRTLSRRIAADKRHHATAETLKRWHQSQRWQQNALICELGPGQVVHLPEKPSSTG